MVVIKLQRKFSFEPKNKNLFLFEDAYDIENFDDLEQYGKNMKQLLLLETEGKPKVLKELNKKTLLKNNVKSK